MQKNITERLVDIVTQAKKLSETVEALPDGADPFQLGPLLNDLVTAVSAAQSRITTRPNETITKQTVVSAAQTRQIAELNKIFARPSEPVHARIEIERNHLFGLVDSTTTSAYTKEDLDRLDLLARLDGTEVTVVWDPVLGIGRLDLTQAAAAAFDKG